jgi:hypothetical protein
VWCVSVVFGVCGEWCVCVVFGVCGEWCVCLSVVFGVW